LFDRLGAPQHMEDHCDNARDRNTASCVGGRVSPLPGDARIRNQLLGRPRSSKAPNRDFTLIDVRSPATFANGHVAGAINIPHAQMTQSRMAESPKDRLIVVYCAGPHCKGANKAALRLACLGLAREDDDRWHQGSTRGSLSSKPKARSVWNRYQGPDS
jgi:rhodanese-related sulfurtransferase